MYNIEWGGIQNVDIELSLNNGEKINANDLSDWEKQLLATYGLSNFLDDQEDIFIFDEPDTYLHPNWQRSFIPDITNWHGFSWLADSEWSGLLADDWVWLVTSREIPSHFIITTHSPLLVGSSDKIDIYWLENVWGNTQIKCSSNNQVDPKWSGFNLIDVYGNRADFIYKEVFGLESTRALEIEDLVTRLHDSLSKQRRENQDVEIEKSRKQLSEYIGDDITDLDLSYLSTESLTKLLLQARSNEKNK